MITPIGDGWLQHIVVIDDNARLMLVRQSRLGVLRPHLMKVKHERAGCVIWMCFDERVSAWLEATPEVTMQDVFKYWERGVKRFCVDNYTDTKQ